MSPAQRSIAFLRAINVGGHTVKMDRLRTLFTELGFAHVATYIASGNVIFETPKVSAQALDARDYFAAVLAKGRRIASGAGCVSVYACI